MMLSPLADWESFYVIIGSSAAALIGLQFVVMALIPESNVETSSSTIAAFGTPTIVHLGAALLVAGTLSAPWESLARAGIALAVVGLAGMIYSVVTTIRAHRQKGYKPVLEDWIWHSILPFLGYGALMASATTLDRNPASSLFVTGAAVMLLVFIGIHNAWDTVIFIAVDKAKPDSARKKAK